MFDVGFTKPNFICATGLTSDLKYMYLYRESSGKLGSGEHDLAWIYLDAQAPIPVYLEARRRDSKGVLSTTGQWVTLNSLVENLLLAGSFDFRNRGKAAGSNPSDALDAPSVEYVTDLTPEAAIVVGQIGIDLDATATFSLGSNADVSSEFWSQAFSLGYAVADKLSVSPLKKPASSSINDSAPTPLKLNPGVPPEPPLASFWGNGPAGTTTSNVQWTFGDSRGIADGSRAAMARGLAGQIDPARVFKDGEQLRDFRAMMCSCYSMAASISNTPLQEPVGGDSLGASVLIDPSKLTYPTEDHRRAGEYLLSVPANIAYRMQRLAKLGVIPPDAAVIPAKLWVKDGDPGVSFTPIDYGFGKVDGGGGGGAGIAGFRETSPATIGWYQYALAGVAIVAAVVVTGYVTYKIADCYDKAKAKEAAEAVDIQKIWARQSTVLKILDQQKDAPPGAPMNEAQKTALNDAYAGERLDNKKWEDALKQEKSAANQLAEDFGSALKTGAVVGAIGLTAYMGLKLVLSSQHHESDKSEE